MTDERCHTSRFIPEVSCDNRRATDVVALLVDQPQHELRRGDIGSVVQLFSSTKERPSDFIVEFVDETGMIQAEADFTDPSVVLKLRYRPHLRQLRITLIV